MTDDQTAIAGAVDPARRPDSFAAYLAKLLMASGGLAGGYSEGTVDEALPLAAACDYILTKSNGLTFSILCIVDAEANPARRFGLDRKAVVEIAKTCRRLYAGRISASKMPVAIEIIEVRKRVTRDDLLRLKPLRSRFRQIIGAYAVDLTEKTATGNFRALYDVRKRFIERALREPRRAASALVPPEPVAAPTEDRKPILTYSILALLAAIFPTEPMLSPSIETLVAFGGLYRPLVLEQGEWYRLITSFFLHASLLHLLFNGIALWMAGRVLESLLGRPWLLALFFVGGIGGALMSLAINPAEQVSIGASGAIMGLLAAAWVSSFRLANGAQRVAVQMRMMRVLIPSLLPIFTNPSGGSIDYACHLGGALVGAVLGVLLLKNWPRVQPHPPFPSMARGLAVVAVATIAFSGFRAFGGYEREALVNLLIPAADIPHTDEDAIARAETLVKEYPHDPRSHFYRALDYLSITENAKAESELRIALGEKQILDTQFKPGLRELIVALLAETLVKEGRADEAKTTVEPFCHPEQGGEIPESIKSLALCGSN
jgi:rhomboid protease GluP